MQLRKEGKRGRIYLKEEGGKKIALKEALNAEKIAAVNKEIRILEKLRENNVDFVPVVRKQGDGWFEYEFIEGNTMKDVLNESSGVSKELVLRLQERIYWLDKAGVEHGELSRPFTNIIVDDSGEIFVIDFERGKVEGRKGKNLRQFAQWLRKIGYMSFDKVKKVGNIKEPDTIYNFIRENVEKV